MRIAVPVDENDKVVSMFGSAPAFLIVDTETGEKETVPNINSCGGCSVGCSGGKSPADLLAENNVDVLLIEKLPKEPFMKLARKGIVVYQLPTDVKSADEAVELFKNKELKVLYLPVS
jgi:predicted Fe-Mo cluster-binding NifX family protein